MNYTRKLCMSVLAATGFAVSAPGLAMNTGQEPISNAAATIPSSDSYVETVTINESTPNLVFADGAWYTLADGDWYGLTADGEWVAVAGYCPADDATDALYHSVAEVSDGTYYAMDDGTLYTYQDGQWYTWVPIELVMTSTMSDSQKAGTPYADPTTASYRVQLYDMDGSPMYSLDDGSLQAVLPVVAGEAPSYVVFLR
jgi:hypothetical protein